VRRLGILNADDACLNQSAIDGKHRRAIGCSGDPSSPGKDDEINHVMPPGTPLEADHRASQAAAPERQRTAQERDGVTMMPISPLTRRLAIAAAGVTALSALLNGAESLLHGAPGNPARGSGTRL
jgi:hypothetical protein